MAVNSKREQIILQIKEELEGISSIETVQRVRPSLSGLAAFSSAQLPLIALESGLPIPVQKVSSRVPGGVDLFISKLEIKLFCYALENTEPDSLISNLADDVWAKVYSDPEHNKLCLETDIEPKVQVAIWHPFIAFNFKVTVTYKHTTGGI